LSTFRVVLKILTLNLGLRWRRKTV